MTTVPIFSDTLSTKELQKEINQHSDGSIPLTIIDNPDKFRSPLSDPTIVGAIIQTGGAILAALISVIAALYINRKNEKKTENGGIIIINIQASKNTEEKSAQSKIIIHLDDFKLEDHKDEILELEQKPEKIIDISYVEG